MCLTLGDAKAQDQVKCICPVSPAWLACSVHKSQVMERAACNFDRSVAQLTLRLTSIE